MSWCRTDEAECEGVDRRAARPLGSFGKVVNLTPMIARPIIAVLVLVLPTLAGAPAIAAEWPLVTTQEETRDEAAPHASQAIAPTASGAPVIDIKQPNISYALHN